MMPMMGLVLGVGMGALRDFLDRGFRTGSQVEALLGTTCLALIPLQKSDLAKKSVPNSTGNQHFDIDSSNPGKIVPEQHPIRTVVDQPFSRFSEEIRSLKLTADLTAVAKTRVLGLTSSVPGEGKSTVAGALAQSIAQTGSRVILVDCDIRNPSLSRIFAPNAALGILDVLSGEASLDQVLCEDPAGNLVFLPTTAKSRVAHSSEILASTALRRLFEKLRASYDYVIVDLPPLAPLVDVRATTHFIDSYIFVIEWGKTYTTVVQHALSRAPQVYNRLLGTVLNKVEINQLSLYDGHRANYYNNESYGRYGYHD
jgi:polysaccharide biosynthesis transport protein